MRLTVAEFPALETARERAWERLREHVQAARSDVVLLPEMPFADWLAASAAADARAWQAAVELHERWLSRLDELAPARVISTRPVGESAGRRNRAYTRSGGATRDLRDKYYLPDEPGYWEASWYGRGDVACNAFAMDGVSVGVQICTEMWFFQHARQLGQAGAHLLAVPRATPRDTFDRWLAGGRAAAVVAGAYHASANLREPAGVSTADLGGRGWIIDPEGEVLAVTSEAMPFVTLDIDLEVAAAAKRGYPRYVLD